MFQTRDFNSASIAADIIFGAIGLAAFIYGKKMVSARAMLLGVALMGFQFVVSDPVWTYVVGALLTAALFFP